MKAKQGSANFDQVHLQGNQITKIKKQTPYERLHKNVKNSVNNHIEENFKTRPQNTPIHVINQSNEIAVHSVNFCEKMINIADPVHEDTQKNHQQSIRIQAVAMNHAKVLFQVPSVSPNLAVQQVDETCEGQ